jgi:hypothetical protein
VRRVVVGAAPTPGDDPAARLTLIDHLAGLIDELR